jgi:hypothetical protein
LTIFTVSELKKGEAFETSPFLLREIAQYHIQTVNFQASKKGPIDRETVEKVSKQILGKDAEKNDLTE